MKKITKRQKKKRTCYDYLQRQEETYRNDKIKSLIDFDDKYISSIKSLAVKKETKVNLTTRLLNGKMLMFFKTSIQSFVYVMLMFLCFQMKTFRKFMKAMRSKNVSCIKTWQIQTVHLYFSFLFVISHVQLMKKHPRI